MSGTGPGRESPVITDAAGATAFLESLIRPGPRPYAGRRPQAAVGALLARLGDPQRGLPVVHVTGSKGKGSTVLLAEAILEAAGVRTGAFTSPHLERWSERYRLDGAEIRPEAFTHLMASLQPHVAALAGPDGPGFFDTLTAGALLLFRRAGVDCALVEVGLGGRLDATNVVEPTVSCITGVELEHVDRLGPTLAAIAAHKAGIVEPGVPLVLGPLPAEAAAVALERARAVDAPVWRWGREVMGEVTEEDEDGLGVRLRAGDLEVETRLTGLGHHQAVNAALALACVAALDRFASAQLRRAARTGLAAVLLPGRTEVLSRRPWVVVDGAHTAASARALARTLERLPATRRHLVLSTSGERDLDTVLGPLLAGTQAVTLTRADPVRSTPPENLAGWIQRHHPAVARVVEPDPVAAVRRARAGLTGEGLLCATGSVYMAGVARAVLRR